MTKQRLWTRDFVTVFVTNVFLSLVFYVLLATMASYAIDDFHASTSVAGLVTGIFLIGAIIGRLLTGRLIEERGSKRLLLIGITLNLLTSALYFWINA